MEPPNPDPFTIEQPFWRCNRGLYGLGADATLHQGPLLALN